MAIARLFRQSECSLTFAERGVAKQQMDSLIGQLHVSGLGLVEIGHRLEMTHPRLVAQPPLFESEGDEVSEIVELRAIAFRCGEGEPAPRRHPRGTSSEIESERTKPPAQPRKGSRF